MKDKKADQTKKRDISPKIEPIDKRPPENLGQWLVLKFMYGLTKFLFHTRYVGLENVPDKGPLLVVANHQSMFDVTTIMCKIRPWVYMLAKIELFKYSPLRRFFYWYGAFPVDRQKMDLKTARRVLTVLGRGDFIGLFPEGTRVKRKTRPEDYLPNEGAVYFAQKMNCPILPISIERPNRLFRCNSVFIGPPLSVAELAESCAARDHQSLSLELMRRIYALQGYAYDTTATAAVRKEKHNSSEA